MVVYDNHEIGKDKLPDNKEIIPRKKEMKTVNEESTRQRQETKEKEKNGGNDLIAIVVGCVATVILIVTAVVGLYHLVWKKTRQSNRQPAMNSSIENENCGVTDSNVRMITLHEHKTQTNKGDICGTETHQHLLTVVEHKV